MSSKGHAQTKVHSMSDSQTGDEALTWIAERIQSGKARNVVVLTGAGISTSAGIPDFRSPETGLYANLQALDLPFPEAVFELNYFKENPKPFWILAKELYPGKHLPTPTHYFIKLLHDKGSLRRVFTQNIDTLEHLTSLPSDKIIEAHGSFASAHCLDCGVETSTEYVLASGVRKGEIVYCAEEDCDGLVKPDIVFFGEGLPDKFFDRISDMAECDLVIVIGTSLQVQPFSLLPDRVKSTVPRLLINREAVGPFESLERGSSGGARDRFTRILGSSGSRSGDRFWKGDADAGVRRLCDQLGWRDDLETLVKTGRETLDKKWKSVEKASEAGEGELRDNRAEETVGDISTSIAKDAEGSKRQDQALVDERAAQSSQDKGSPASDGVEELDAALGKVRVSE